MKELFQSELFWSVVIFLIGCAVRSTVRYFVHVWPVLKKLRLVEKWEAVIALVNQYRKDYLKKFPDEKKAPYENIIEKVKEFSKMFGVEVADVTAHRRKIKDDGLRWSTIDDSGSVGTEVSLKIADEQIDPDTTES